MALSGQLITNSGSRAIVVSTTFRLRGVRHGRVSVTGGAIQGGKKETTVTVGSDVGRLAAGTPGRRH